MEVPKYGNSRTAVTTLGVAGHEPGPSLSTRYRRGRSLSRPVSGIRGPRQRAAPTCHGLCARQAILPPVRVLPDSHTSVAPCPGVRENRIRTLCSRWDRGSPPLRACMRTLTQRRGGVERPVLRGQRTLRIPRHLRGLCSLCISALEPSYTRSQGSTEAPGKGKQPCGPPPASRSGTNRCFPISMFPYFHTSISTTPPPAPPRERCAPDR